MDRDMDSFVWDERSSPRPAGGTKREAVERLLDWGFTPVAIAKHLRCSLAWVHAVRRQRKSTGEDTGVHPWDLRRMSGPNAS